MLFDGQMLKAFLNTIEHENVTNNTKDIRQIRHISTCQVCRGNILYYLYIL